MLWFHFVHWMQNKSSLEDKISLFGIYILTWKRKFNLVLIERICRRQFNTFSVEFHRWPLHEFQLVNPYSGFLSCGIKISIGFNSGLWGLKAHQMGFCWQILTLSQKRNFRPFQTEWICKRQFQILWKWKKALQTGRKHCGKRRNCSLRAIFPFPTVFSKDL